MIRKTIFELKSLYRENMRIKGYQFGDGEKTVCILGATRGNEIQQVYICSQLVNTLKSLEEQGKITDGKSIMVIPSINSYSMNTQKRFWPTDNTDINRMFPGYYLGETTQRIASGVFEQINSYKYGIQFASFYIPGIFTPHVRMLKTSYENTEAAKDFGLPYIMLRTPKPYDTTTLNYNWQLWGTQAFSLYTHETDRIDEESALQAQDAVLNFLDKNGIIDYKRHRGYISEVFENSDLVTVKPHSGGMFMSVKNVNEHVNKGDVLAKIIHPFEGNVIEEIKSPVDGTVFFSHSSNLCNEHSLLFRILPDGKIKY
ncbi:MAG: succinylglutamate desuccinylase/aspartoacylase family protein [Acutalibacteraceae bacterium]